MGNICSKASDPDTSTAARQGRPLGSAPATNNGGATSTYGGVISPKPTASIPMNQKQKPKVTGPGRTLGGPNSTGGDRNIGAAEAAARAAEAREQAGRAAAAGKGSLSAKLDAQKRQTSARQSQQVTDQDTLAWN